MQSFLRSVRLVGGQYMEAGFDSDTFQTAHVVDENTVVEQRWNESTDNESTFIPSREVRAFLDRISRGTKLVVRVWDFGDEAHTAEFDLTGVQWALEQLPCLTTPSG